MLQECQKIATLNAAAQAAHSHWQRRNHTIARQIEKHAEKIWKLTEGDPVWREMVVERGVHALRKITHVALRGAPQKLRPPIGLHYLGQCYCQAHGKKKVPRSRSGPFADVLRIVYGVRDPMPVIKEILATDPKSVVGIFPIWTRSPVW